MIIVDGPDGSGKTTLIERLGFIRRQLKSLRGGVGGTTPVGWTLPGETPLEAYRRQLHQAAVEEFDVKRIAFDRFHLSEMVYGPILRNEQLIDEECLTGLNELLHIEYRVPIILCLPPYAATLKNVLQEGRERPDYQTEEFLARAYRAWTNVVPWATQVFDYTRDSLPKV